MESGPPQRLDFIRPFSRSAEWASSFCSLLIEWFDLSPLPPWVPEGRWKRNGRRRDQELITAADTRLEGWQSSLKPWGKNKMIYILSINNQNRRKRHKKRDSDDFEFQTSNWMKLCRGWMMKWSFSEKPSNNRFHLSYKCEKASIYLSSFIKNCHPLYVMNDSPLCLF